MNDVTDAILTKRPPGPRHEETFPKQRSKNYVASERPVGSLPANG